MYSILVLLTTTWLETHQVYNQENLPRYQQSVQPEEVRQGQKVKNEMITCLYKLNGEHT